MASLSQAGSATGGAGAAHSFYVSSVNSLRTGSASAASQSFYGALPTAARFPPTSFSFAAAAAGAPSSFAAGRLFEEEGSPPRAGSAGSAAAGVPLAAKAAPKHSKIHVGVRSRPLSGQELAYGDEDVWSYDPEQGVMSESVGSGRKDYHFDRVFPPDTRNKQVYEQLGKPIVAAALEGYHSTLFAYGQTGSGKTHTLLGTTDEPGLTLLAMQEVFEQIEKAGPGVDYSIKVSYIEIYQEVREGGAGGGAGGQGGQ